MISTPSAAPESRPEIPESAPQPLNLVEGNGRDIRAGRPQLARLLARRDSYRRLARIAILLTIDLVGVFAALATAITLKDIAQGDFDAAAAASGAADYLPFAFLVTALLFARAGLYGSREARPGLARVIATLFQVAVIALVFALVSGSRFSTYWLFYGGLLFACIYVGGLRHSFDALTGRLLTSLGYRRRAVLIGSPERAAAVARALGDRAGQRYEPVGFFSTANPGGSAGANGHPHPNGNGSGSANGNLSGNGNGTAHGIANGLPDLGDLADLPARIAADAIEEVVIADPDFPQDQAVELISDCHAQGVCVRVAASTIEILTQRAELVPGEGLPLLEVKPPVFEGFEFAVKRSFDFVGSAVLLLVSSPVLAATAVLVKLTSPGPILHRSLRPGIGGRPFQCLKFRTMYEDAESRQPELEHLNEKTGAIFKLRNDPRVTPVGRFLRRNSLDELPQLFNVLRGEMSLIGPRPLPLRDHSRLEDWHRRRYLVLPGITGLWQVSGRADLDFDDMVRLDFLYLERWSILLDLVILVKTVPAVLRKRGAY